MNSMVEDFVVTPWEVKGKIDYEKLSRDFGVEKFSKIMHEIPDPNLYMRRNIIFGHRDFKKIVEKMKSGEKFVMMTGLMPSGKFHIGHKMLADQIIDYQKKGGKIYLCVADVEAFNTRMGKFDELKRVAIEEYLMNYIALGLKPENVDFYFQSERSVNAKKSNAFYKLAGRVAKYVTMNEIRAIYGDVNPGKIMSIMIQVADILHPQLDEFEGRVPVVVPVGIDQDPHIRLTRDIASRMGDLNLIPPSSTYHVFMPGLKGDKMSSSDPTSFIALTDSPEEVENKIMKYAFSGGRDSLEEHKKLGGVPEIDVSYQMLSFMLEEDDEKLKKIYDDYKSGNLLSGELKQILIEKLNKFLKEHQEKREKAKDVIDEFMMKD